MRYIFSSASTGHSAESAGAFCRLARYYPAEGARNESTGFSESTALDIHEVIIGAGKKCWTA